MRFLISVEVERPNLTVYETPDPIADTLRVGKQIATAITGFRIVLSPRVLNLTETTERYLTLEDAYLKASLIGIGA